jgi:hypothetical protein
MLLYQLLTLSLGDLPGSPGYFLVRLLPPLSLTTPHHARISFPTILTQRANSKTAHSRGVRTGKRLNESVFLTFDAEMMQVG